LGGTVALLDWNDSYSVGVAKFDDQHKKLFGMINTLNDAMKVGKSKDALGVILKGLIEYTATHFTDEERMMAQHEFLQLQMHKNEHNKLVKQVVQLQADYNSGKALLSLEVMNFLRDWLNTHIMGTDKKYGVFFNGKEIK
jgi:hemerythrin